MPGKNIVGTQCGRYDISRWFPIKKVSVEFTHSLSASRSVEDACCGYDQFDSYDFSFSGSHEGGLVRYRKTEFVSAPDFRVSTDSCCDARNENYWSVEQPWQFEEIYLGECIVNESMVLTGAQEGGCGPPEPGTWENSWRREYFCTVSSSKIGVGATIRYTDTPIEPIVSYPCAKILACNFPWECSGSTCLFFDSFAVDKYEDILGTYTIERDRDTPCGSLAEATNVARVTIEIT